MSEENTPTEPKVKSLFKSAAEREPIESAEKNVWLGRILVTLVWLTIISGCLYFIGGGTVEVSEVNVVTAPQSQIYELMADSSKWNQWIVLASGIRRSQGELEVGQVYEVRSSLLGIPVTEKWTITENTENSLLFFDIDSPVRKSELDISIERGQGGTVVNIYYKNEYRGVGRIVSPLIFESRILQRTIANIRTLPKDFPPLPPRARGAGGGQAGGR